MFTFWKYTVAPRKAGDMKYKYTLIYRLLLSPTTGKAKQFPVMRNNFILLLLTGDIHWVCVSNIGCSHNNQVKLYDSLYTGIAAECTNCKKWFHQACQKNS